MQANGPAPRVLLLSYADGLGGAAIAARRLLDGFADRALDVQMLVERKHTRHPRIHALPVLSRALNALRRRSRARWREWRYPHGSGLLFSELLGTDRLQGPISRLRPDLLHVHWTGTAFLSPRTLSRIGVPVIWSLHDMMPLTGGCHLDTGCRRFRDTCGSCPVLGSSTPRDLSHRQWRRKQEMYGRGRVTAVAPSRWLADVARESSLLREADIRVIPNGLDTDRFRPRPSEEGRRAFGLPRSKKLVLFGAVGGTRNPTKGFRFLVAALTRLRQRPSMDDVDVVVFGQTRAGWSAAPGFPVHFCGALYDEARLALLYSAVDVFVAPSLAENLPSTVMEALSCGTPVVAFRSGGIPDLVAHERNGWLAEPGNPDQLAAGIEWVLARSGEPSLSERARAGVLERFRSGEMVDRYDALYREQLARGRDRSRDSR